MTTNWPTGRTKLKLRSAAHPGDDYLDCPVCPVGSWRLCGSYSSGGTTKLANEIVPRDDCCETTCLLSSPDVRRPIFRKSVRFVVLNSGICSGICQESRRQFSGRWNSRIRYYRDLAVPRGAARRNLRCLANSSVALCRASADPWNYPPRLLAPWRTYENLSRIDWDCRKPPNHLLRSALAGAPM